jgi:5-methylcytosine-specific restriction endonuclease McrA
MAKKVKKVAKPRAGAAPKTRNAGTWTDSQFLSFIRSALRQKSRWWLPILNVREKAKRPYTGVKKNQKWEYQCVKCNNWFMAKDVSVDHINPVGSLRSVEELPKFVENLFCTEDNLQVLCQSCHLLKTNEEKAKGYK